jgi:hypothetical protein
MRSGERVGSISSFASLYSGYPATPNEEAEFFPLTRRISKNSGDSFLHDDDFAFDFVFADLGS